MDVAFLLFGLLAGVTGNHLYEEIPAEYEETVKLERLNGDGRLKRQDLDFPDTLEYSFNLKQDKKSLRLKRNTYVRDYVPLTLHRKGVNKRLTGYEEEFSKSAFYLDGETGAAVFLHCEDLNEDCSMYGMFHHKGEQYVVHPAENGFHRIKRALHDKIDLSYDIPERIDKSRIEKAMALKHIFREGLVEEHTIEISFFLDDSVYSYFLDKYKGNPTLALKWLLRYYVQAANEMHLRYRSVQETYPYFKINILLNEVVVMKELSDCPWIEHNLYSPDEVLISARDSFARWQNDNKDNYIQYDHALAITRRTLLADRGNGPQPGILGISYYDGVCANPEIAVSLEMDNYKGIFGHITAHEIGHNIGAYHDGTVGCDDVLMRVMGKFSRFPPNPRTTFNTWFFSDCSIRQFLYFFDRVVGKPSCTMDTLGEGAALEEQLKVPLGGETYTLDEQCQFSLGNDSFFLGYVGKYLCEQGIYCYNPEQNDFMSIYTFHHTKCGKRKVRMACLSNHSNLLQYSSDAAET